MTQQIASEHLAGSPVPEGPWPVDDSDWGDPDSGRVLPTQEELIAWGDAIYERDGWGGPSCRLPHDRDVLSPEKPSGRDAPIKDPDRLNLKGGYMTEQRSIAQRLRELADVVDTSAIEGVSVSMSALSCHPRTTAQLVAVINALPGPFTDRVSADGRGVTVESEIAGFKVWIFVPADATSVVAKPTLPAVVTEAMDASTERTAHNAEVASAISGYEAARDEWHEASDTVVS